jgi:UDP-glucose 4-epimerase
MPDMSHNWVIGSGGLLGSHITASLARQKAHVWRCPIRKFSWTHTADLTEQFIVALTAFAAGTNNNSPRIIYWAAGAAVVGSSEETLRQETDTWRLFLELVPKHLHAGGDHVSTYLFLASSAGGVYADNRGALITEESAPSPISPYGWAKLDQERILEEWSKGIPDTYYLVGRISTLYGPGQNLAKPQGLLSHIARCLILNQPLHLYMPLDTIRDYMRVDECADHIVRCMRHLMANPSQQGMQRGFLKIFASEHAMSLAQVVAIFARVSHRHLKLICTPSPVGRQHPMRLQYRSTLWRHLRATSEPSMEEGIAQLYQYHLSSYGMGRLRAS